MNVLSLFDGLAVGKLALDAAGISNVNYYASEINKPVTQLIARRHPNIVQLGDVKDWATWNLPKIDLLIGGSPCQDLSVCSGKGKGLDGAKSGLFWEYVKVLNAVKPTWFLLENVKMNKVSRDIITSTLGVQPVEIDSAIFSAQTRKRLYWTNIPIPHIVGLNPKLNKWDIQKLLAKDKKILSRGAEQTISQRYSKNTNIRKRRILAFNNNDDYWTENDHPCLYNYWNDRLFYEKAPTLTTYSGSWSAKVGLVCVLCSWFTNKPSFFKVNRYIFEYLQTLPIGYTDGLSRTEAFRAVGNCWTKDVIAHIFKGLP